MKKILFVEDNEVLLELYSVLMDWERDFWQTTLAPSGEFALRLLRHNVYDVVVADMQMPGVNGIELLTEVRQRHPRTSRIIISGFTDQAVAADSLKCTHLFIPKPFNAKLLSATLSRITSLDAYLKDEKLRGLAAQMRALPSFPTMYLDILREIESPTSSVHGVAEVVTRDPGIAAKVLQAANSAGMGLSEPVHDTAEAVQQLGLNTVRALALSAQVYERFAPGRLTGFSADGLWRHLMKCGELARTMMRGEGGEAADCEDAFTAGMLHDMGKLMLADSLPEEFGQALALAEQEKISLTDAEQEIFGATHAGLAAYLLGLWGLPASVVEAVAFHQTPEKSDLNKYSPLTAVHVASSLADETGATPLNTEYLARIGVMDRVDDWREAAAELAMEPQA